MSITRSLRPHEALAKVLQNLTARVEGARGVALADRNGLPIASDFRQRMDLTTVVAMGTLVVQASENVYEALGHDGFECGILEGVTLKVLVCRVGGGRASIVVILEPEANLGLAKLETIRAASEVSAILEL